MAAVTAGPGTDPVALRVGPWRLSRLGAPASGGNRQHGLSGSEAMTLAFLLREPGCAAVVVRHALGFHRSTLSSLLDRLESKELISRAPSSYDGRRLEIELTVTGRIAAEIAETVIRDVDDELATYTSPSERRAAEAVFAACTAINGSRNGLDF